MHMAEAVIANQAELKWQKMSSDSPAEPVELFGAFMTYHPSGVQLKIKVLRRFIHFALPIIYADENQVSSMQMR